MATCKFTRKRFVLQDTVCLPFLVESSCPKCKQHVELSLEVDDYAVFRLAVNEKDVLWMLCYECDHEFEVPVKLNISMETL